MDPRKNELSSSMVQMDYDMCLNGIDTILINGSPSCPFNLQRGLRQGDPLSPFLYVLIVEALNQMMKKATRLNLWKGVKICKNGLMITHLQYADDTLIFSDASLAYLKNIKQALILFHQASELQVNSTYLGLLIGGNLSRIKAWDPIIEKLSKNSQLVEERCCQYIGEGLHSSNPHYRISFSISYPSFQYRKVLLKK